MSIRPRALLLAFLLLLTACGGSDGGGTANGATSEATVPVDEGAPSDVLAPPPGVLDREWLVVAIVDGDDEIFPPEDLALTLEFDGSSVTGSAGCNDYRGDAVFTAGQLAVSVLALTERACADATDWMPMLAVLEAATHVELLGDSLFVWAGEDRALFLR